ncbi:MAG TPA: glycosyltransferase [Edaphobacter sp.]|jgi:glycosyltransferase involved in cell wall biosynthesis|nr:glycosyltransferase [Edaphobacter sp.]
MNLLVTAMSSAARPSRICNFAYDLVRCAASSKEEIRVTLAIGKWQELYFRRQFKLDDTRTTIVPVDIPNNPFARSLWHLHELPRLAENIAADVIHLASPVPVRRSVLRRPIVVSLHDLKPCDASDNFGFPDDFFNRVFFHRCLMEVDCVTCATEASRNALKTRFPRIAQRKGVVVGDCPAIQCDEARRPECDTGQFILMIAQHRAAKDIPLMLEVFGNLLREKQIDKGTFLVLVIDQGPEAVEVKFDLKRRALETTVRLIGEVSDGELRWLYENCEALIIPSLVEGRGLTLVEGLLCGSRVVCSDIPVFREIGGKTCHYFDLHAESRSSALAAAICCALAEPARSMEKRGRFSIEKIAQEYATLYSRLIKVNPNGVAGEKEIGCATA